MCGKTASLQFSLTSMSRERTRQLEAEALASYRRKLLADDGTTPAARAALRRVANAMDARARAAAAEAAR